MSSMCKSSSAVGCEEEYVPVRATYDNLYRRPESDAEFVKSVVEKEQGANRKRKWAKGPEVVDSYSCRRTFLRSYTFTKKESFSERTMKRLGKFKESPSLLGRVKRKYDEKKNRRKRRNKKEICFDAREELTKVCYAVFRSIFRRLLSCTTKIDVIDHPHRRSVDVDG